MGFLAFVCSLGFAGDVILCRPRPGQQRGPHRQLRTFHHPVPFAWALVPKCSSRACLLHPGRMRRHRRYTILADSIAAMGAPSEPCRGRSSLHAGISSMSSWPGGDALIPQKRTESLREVPTFSSKLYRMPGLPLGIPSGLAASFPL